MSLQNFDQIENSIHAVLNELPPKSKIAVAVSGGGDSMALLLALHKCLQQKPALDIDLVALTVDHKLRPEAALEAKQVANWCHSLGIQHHILNWQYDEKPTSAIQQKARDARYQLMTEYCLNHQIQYLFVAHNQEDNAETLLMRLKRGAGLSGLTGIAAQSTRAIGIAGSIELMRPLLNIPREDLRQFLRYNGQEWFDDASNQDEKFERVQVRNFLATQDVLQNQALAQTAQKLNRANDAIEHYLEAFWQQQVSLLKFGIAQVAIEEFNKLPQELKLRLLARLVWTIGGQKHPPRWQKIENLLDQIDCGVRQICLGNCYMVKKTNGLWFGFENRHIEKQPPRLKPLEKAIWQGRLFIQNHLANEVEISNLVQQPEHLETLIKQFPELKNCPKIILNEMPIITDTQQQIIHPSAAININIELKLIIRR